MSTNTKKKHGTGAAVILIVLCMLALGTLGYIIWRQFNPVVPETAAGYVAAAGTTAPVYDENGTQLGSLVRGAEVQYVAEDAEGGADRVRVVNGEGYAYLDAANLTADYNGAVLTETVYALRGMSLTDETGVVPGCAVEKGMALTVTGFDGLDENGEVLRWAVSCDRGEGYIDGENVRMTEEEALAQYDEALYQRHAARGDAWGGGDAADLDYYPTEKPAFTDNVMPDEVRALYLNGSAIQYADSYIRLAQGTGINAFVVDIVDGTAVSYASPVMQQYSPSAYAAAQDTMEGFKANVQKLRDAGYYVIGRITVFNDAHLAADHPEYVISDLNGTPLKISSMYWPSAYNRTVWQYKVELALEAAALGFNEIQFDYIRFPDGAYKYEQAGTIDYKNTYGESKAQAVQRFLIYAAQRLHDAGTTSPATYSASAPTPMSPPAASTGRPSAPWWTPSPVCPTPTITAPRGTISPGSTPIPRSTTSARAPWPARARRPPPARYAHGYSATTPSASRITTTAQRSWPTRSGPSATLGAPAAL